jgi:[ribosomal protein S18]-alanine N-acetyltransferase
MAVSYRPLARADQRILWDFLHLAIFAPPGQDPPPRELILQPELARYVEAWGKEGDLGVLALDGDVPVGAAWMRLMHGYGFVEEDIPELSIAILSGYRGKGIGTSLLKALIDSAAPIYQAISLSATSENPAVRLYERLGFQVVNSVGDSKIMLLRIKK